MTLIVSASYHDYAIQVSDRLVTRAKRTYDPEFSKTVLAYLPDALVAIAFTGAAFIGRQSTPVDQWVAEELADVGPLGLTPDSPPPRHPRKHGPFIMGHGAQVGKPLGKGVSELKRSLEETYGATPTPFSIRIDIVGFQWTQPDERYVRQVLWHLTPYDGGTRYDWTREPTRWAALGGGRLFYNAIGDTPPDLRPLGDKLRASHGSVQDAEDAAVAFVRHRASTSKYVGDDCMSITMERPVNDDPELSVHIRHLPLAHPTFRTREGIAEGAYTPWMIGGEVTIPPSKVVGPWTHQLGAVRVHLDAPDLPTSYDLLHGLDSQVRKPGPRY
jgi:hypothetical protein